MMKVLVLLSTYNGEQYLSEQLASIFSQQDVDCHLLVRDDGSTDSTLSIIQEYRNKYKRKIELLKGENIGWKASYMWLARYAITHYHNYGFYAFCDQDDVWLPVKLKHALDKLHFLPSGPQLYCSNLFHYEDGVNKGLIRPLHIVPTIKNCLIRNYATGCTVVFNKALLEYIVKDQPKIPFAHDYWAYLLANFLGSVVVDDNAYILYRQHNANQIGSKRSFTQIWKRRLSKSKNLIGLREKEIIARELLRIHGSSIEESNKAPLVKIANYRNSISMRLALLFDQDYSYNKRSSDFWLKLRILLGRL